MRILTGLACALLCSFAATAQNASDSTVKLDLLNAPSAPAFNILGIATNDIERPTDLTQLSVSLQQATQNFSALPNSFAIQVAPFLYSRKHYSLRSFNEKAKVVPQTLELSLGMTHMGPKGFEDVDSLKSVKLGFGLKFSLIRPDWTRATVAAFEKMTILQKAILQDYRARESKGVLADSLALLKARRKLLNRPDLTPAEQLEKGALVQAIGDLTERLAAATTNDVEDSDMAARLKAAATAFKMERRGGFLDFNSGFALDFANDRIGNARIYRGGAWLTGGYEGGNKGFSCLFIARYLHHPETVFADPKDMLEGTSVSTFDAGGKLLLPALSGKFVFSSEAIYRSVLESSIVEPSWRLAVNAEYDLGMNKKLTFAFGRDFDGTISRGGNLIAALNFVLGIGSERKLY